MPYLAGPQIGSELQELVFKGLLDSIPRIRELIRLVRRQDLLQVRYSCSPCFHCDSNELGTSLKIWFGLSAQIAQGYHVCNHFLVTAGGIVQQRTGAPRKVNLDFTQLARR